MLSYYAFCEYPYNQNLLLADFVINVHAYII